MSRDCSNKNGGRDTILTGVIPSNLMKKRFTSYSLLVTILSLLASGNLFARERAGDNAGIAIDQAGVLVYPPKMLNAGVFSGEVRAVISIDDQGTLTDCLVIGYTNQGFVDAAIAAVKRWVYQPAMVMGRARASRAEVLFTFRDRGVIVQNLPGALEHYQTFGSQEDRYVYQPCKMSQLDRIPEPVHVVHPVLSKSVSPHPLLVEFYIDEEGRVRMPAVGRESADDAFAAAAVSAVEQWRFEPPLCKGKPVLVYAQQPFGPKE